MQLLDDFRLHRPVTLDAALALRAELGEGAALYAGGTELLLAMKLGMLSYDDLIDVKRLGELRGIERREGAVRIGAGVTHRELEGLADVPALAALERSVANVRVRAAGTLGGNLAFAEPHADPPALLTALGARVDLAGAEGTRELAIDDFILGAYETALAEDEIMTAIVVPTGARAIYDKFQVLERPAVGVALALADDGLVVVVGAVDERPVRVPLDGVAPDDAEAVAGAAMEAVDPVDDLSGSAEYKRHLTGVLVRRGLQRLRGQG
jgi:aerobic carbon-monoxide dehydrogenase medium subunit